MEVKVGDRVRVSGLFGGVDMTGLTGTVINISGMAVGVEFDNPVASGHDCNRLGKAGHCKYGPATSLVSATDPVPVTEIEHEAEPKDSLARKKKYLKNAVWDNITKVLENDTIDKVLLYGSPGTGKTTSCYRLMEKMFGKDHVYMTTAHEESIVEELTGQYIPRGTEWSWRNGHATNAYQFGGLIINEINRASGPYATQCHAVLDDREVARLLLPNGEFVTPHPLFKVAATMNGTPDDLHEALRDRFELKIHVPSPSPEAMLTLDDDLIEVVTSAYSNPDNITVTFRQAKAFMKMRKILKEQVAAEMVFGPTGKDIVATMSLNRKNKLPWEK